MDDLASLCTSPPIQCISAVHASGSMQHDTWNLIFSLRIVFGVIMLSRCFLLIPFTVRGGHIISLCNLHRWRRCLWNVDDMMSPRIVYRAGTMLVDACSKIHTRCTSRNSMRNRMSSSEVLGYLDLHGVSSPPRCSLYGTRCLLCGFCESPRHARHVMRGSTSRYITCS